MVTRSAIIISCPDRKGSFLRGAVNDPQSMMNFLTSQRGGSWKKEEIRVINEATWKETSKIMRNSPADYQLIYFTGHGCTRGKQRCLQFEDAYVEDTNLLNDNPRQLIIIDSCRNYLPSISGIPPAEDVYSSFTGDSVSRVIFDNCIAGSPYGKMIVHATADGKTAEEAPHGRGGVFTISLLTAALKYQTPNEFSPVGIKELLPKVNETIKLFGYQQQSCIVYNYGELEVPFMIDMDQKLVEEEPVLKSDSKISLADFLGAGLLLFGLYKLLKD
jgi:hypothetical protein